MLLSVYLFVSQHCIHIVRDSINFTIDAWSMSPKYAVVSRFTVSAWRAEKIRSSVPILSSSDSGMFQANSQRPKVQYLQRRRLNERDGQADP